MLPPHMQPHRQLLMYARVRNPLEHVSDRYLDHPSYYLWKYLIEEKHAFEVINSAPCVWLPSIECSHIQPLIAHINARIPVTRYCFEQFNPDTGVTQTKTRFIPDDDAALVTTKLSGHFSASSGFTLAASTPGMALSNFDSAAAVA